MKKIIMVVIILIMSFGVFSKPVKIRENEMIRFRVIANSNSEEDQYIKNEIVKSITPVIKKINKEASTAEETRIKIQEKNIELRNIIDNSLTRNNSSLTYRINYGDNYFPQKEYKNTTIKEGNYESLVITLGEGKGENFWCILFPPLCLLEVEEQENENIEYTSFLKEIFNKYF